MSNQDQSITIPFNPVINRSTVIIGSPEIGKNIFSFLPMIESGITQELPMIVYDCQYPNLTKQVVGLAANKDYDIHIFAPGYKESKICNPLDFIDPENSFQGKKLDSFGQPSNTKANYETNETTKKGCPNESGFNESLMAAQFAAVLNRNFKRNNSKREDLFLKPALDQLVKGLLMLAAETEFPDLLTCNTILGLSSLTDRLKVHRNKIREDTYKAFAIFLASAGSQKTVEKLIVSAANNFSSMMIPEILSSLIGKTDLPSKVTGKTMVILGLDRERRDVLMPILTSTLDLMITQNVDFKRNEPLLLFLNECPTLDLPRLPNWLNGFRSKRLCTVLGIQNIVQMEHKYGKELTKAILGGCHTKIWDNSQGYESVKLLDSLVNESSKLWPTCLEKLIAQSSQRPITDECMRQRQSALEKLYALPKGKR